MYFVPFAPHLRLQCVSWNDRFGEANLDIDNNVTGEPRSIFTTDALEHLEREELVHIISGVPTEHMPDCEAERAESVKNQLLEACKERTACQRNGAAQWQLERTATDRRSERSSGPSAADSDHQMPGDKEPAKAERTKRQAQ